jgi:Mg-chelatase subunit ChlI
MIGRMDDAPKSALELAMERLKKKDAAAGVSETPLSEDQKREIAEVRSSYAAKLAQEEILFKSKLQGLMDFDGRRVLEENYRRDVERLTHERDRKIQKIRQ